MCVLPLFVHVLSMIVLYVCAVMTHQDSARDLQFGPEARGPGVLRETGPGCGGRGGGRFPWAGGPGSRGAPGNNLLLNTSFLCFRTICLPSLCTYVAILAQTILAQTILASACSGRLRKQRPAVAGAGAPPRGFDRVGHGKRWRKLRLSALRWSRLRWIQTRWIELLHMPSWKSQLLG